MKSGLHNNKDFLAGLLFLAFGALTIYFSRDYPLGWVERMGPGYFPTALGSILSLFGFYIMARGLWTGERVAGGWGWRPLVFITLSIVIFGFTLEKIGLVPALVVLLFVAALGGREFRITEVAILAVLMSAFAAGVFIYGLQLPYPLFGSHH